MITQLQSDALHFLRTILTVNPYETDHRDKLSAIQSNLTEPGCQYQYQSE